MAFVKKTWKDRIVQYANRRLLTKSGGEVEQVTVTRDEGTVSVVGDKFDANTMNDLETRIDNAITALESGKLNTTDIHYYYFIGTTTSNKNLVITNTVAPNYDPAKEVIVAISARYANSSGMVVCTPFATTDPELGKFTCFKVQPATEGANTANVIIDGYFWTIPRGIRNNS